MEPTNSTTPDPGNATRHRLIEAAGAVFAEQGFRNATVRDICQRAEANVAAINYHFGDKERLYAAVLAHAYSIALERFPYQTPEPEASPEMELRYFIRSFMARIVSLGQGSWFGKLMAREMVEPSAALDEMVKVAVRPQFEYLTGVLHKILPPETPPHAVVCCAHSIIGQCLFYHFAASVLERVSPLPLTEDRLDQLAEHIHTFSLLALNNWATMLVDAKKHVDSIK